MAPSLRSPATRRRSSPSRGMQRFPVDVSISLPRDKSRDQAVFAAARTLPTVWDAHLGGGPRAAEAGVRLQHSMVNRAWSPQREVIAGRVMAATVQPRPSPRSPPPATGEAAEVSVASY